MKKNPKILDKKFILEIVVFVCGAAVMIFELIGSRIAAPYVGTSIYTWTNLIGVILASLSIGYYVGGYLADKKPHSWSIALIIIFSALAIAFTSLTKDIFSTVISTLPTNLQIKSIIISLILFAPASFFLGMVSPYAVKLKMVDITKSGRTAGNLYALSTAGSIFGTFLGGLYIIPNFGSTNSLMILSVVLLLLVLLLLSGSKIVKPIKISIFILIIFLGLTKLVSTIEQKNIVADIDTAYNRILISHTIDHRTNRPILTLKTDPHGSQAAMFTDGTNDLVFNYTKFYRLFSHFVPNPTNVLMIGGCAYTYPRDFIKNFPNISMDVVEIDSGMTDIARKYFNLTDEKNLTIYHQDARIYLNDNKKKYDVIFGDAFSSVASIPFQLTTLEVVTKKFESLTEGGIVMLNLISAIDGNKGKFARAEYATYKKVFPQVFLFTTVRNIKSGYETQNIMLVALKSDKIPKWENPNKEINGYLSQVWKKPISNDMPILTDDFAPVEYYNSVSL